MCVWRVRQDVRQGRRGPAKSRGGEKRFLSLVFPEKERRNRDRRKHDGCPKMASVTHLEAWRAAAAAVVTWRAPIEVCVAGRW